MSTTIQHDNNAFSQNPELTEMLARIGQLTLADLGRLIEEHGAPGNGRSAAKMAMRRAMRVAGPSTTSASVLASDAARNLAGAGVSDQAAGIIGNAAYTLAAKLFVGPGFPQEQYDLLLGPWRAVAGNGEEE